MNPLISFVQATTYESTPIHLRMPRPVWHLFTLVNKVHAGWRWYRKVELYKTPGKFFQLLAGHALHFLAGDLLVVRIAAQSLLIATRVLECTQQQGSLCKEARKWSAAVRAPDSINFRMRKSRRRVYWISPSSFYFLEHSIECLLLRIQKIAHHTFKLFIRVFRLSMGMMDVMDVLCLNPQSSHDAMNESVVNLIKWIDAIVENRKELLAGIKGNRQIIQRLLENSPLTYEQFYEAVSRTIQGTRAIQKKVNALSEKEKKFMIGLGKRVAGNSLVIMGF